VPPQDRDRGDQAMTAQHRGKASDQHGEQGSVKPVQARPRIASAEYRDPVAQDEQLPVCLWDVVARPSTVNQPKEPAEGSDRAAVATHS
jgi:hypothetical protein